MDKYFQIPEFRLLATTNGKKSIGFVNNNNIYWTLYTGIVNKTTIISYNMYFNVPL